MPSQTLYDQLTFSSLDEALERFRAFARAHNDFEPSLVCERDRSGRRRWMLTVIQRRGRRSGGDQQGTNGG